MSSPAPRVLWKRLNLFSERPYWRCYFPNTSAIIYVIDSADTARLQTSRSELLTMLSEEELNGVPLLVFCNKQDMEGALKPEEISEQLGLAGGEKGRDWSVRGSCATKGEGLEEGLDWYVNPCSIFFLSSINFYISSGWWMQYKRSSRIESRWPFASPIFHIRSIYLCRISCKPFGHALIIMLHHTITYPFVPFHQDQILLLVSRLLQYKHCVWSKMSIISS